VVDNQVLRTPGSGLRPVRLRCDRLVAPTAVDTDSPVMDWALAAETDGETQTAFRVVVRREGEQVWDSGTVPGDECSVRCPAEVLAPLSGYTWQVELTGAGGVPAGTAGSTFATGLRGRPWSGSWIGRDETEPPVFAPPIIDIRTGTTRYLSPPVRLRSTVQVTGELRRAVLVVAARGLFRALVNDIRVGDEELAPGWTDYTARIPYRCADVTDLLRPGANGLGLLLGDGWFAGFTGMDPRRGGKLYGDWPSVLAELHLQYADGRTQVHATGPDWQESAGAVRYSDLLMGDCTDGALEGPWTLADGEIGWRAAAVLPPPTAAVLAVPTPPIRVTQLVPAVGVTAFDNGVQLVDLGQNLVGRIVLTVRSADRGSPIVLRHGEMLQPDGTLYTENLRRAEARDVYLPAGGEVETYRPTFTVHGFRYVEVTGYPGPLDAADISAEVLHSDVPRHGHFETGDPDLDRLAQNIDWGLRGNIVSVPTDCPQRDERLGWLADAQVFAPTATRLADVQAFFGSWLADVRASQQPDGALRDIAPAVVLGNDAAPGWGDAITVLPWTLYRRYGDTAVLAENLDAMTRWVDFVVRHNPDLIWRRRTGRNYGDWLSVGARTPHEVVATAYLAHSARLLSRSAAVLGDLESSQRAAGLADRVAAAFRREFVGADGRITGDTQAGYLFALAFELLEPDQVGPAVAHLVDDIHDRDVHLTTGFLGVALLCPVLARHGHVDLAHRLLAQRSFPGWLFSVRNGATTIWERWDGWTPDGGFGPATMNSFNHYSLGAVGDWMYGGIAGIGQAPDSAGYRDLVLTPMPGPLPHFTARQHLPRGTVEIDYRTTTDGFRLDVTVPPGRDAVFDGRPGGLVPDGGAVLRLAPGRHQLSGRLSAVGPTGVRP
jgi:alpha-L-rhamnosidase